MKEKAIIFDLDGTLLDSLTDIAICANIVLKEFNLPTHEIEDYKNFVGGGAEILIRNCTPKSTTEEDILKLLKRFKEVYEDNLHSSTKPYEGIYELLDLLKKHHIKIGVLSNKPHEFTLKYIDKFFKDYPILEPHGQKKEVPKKPDPTAAINIAKALEVESHNVFFIGDTDVDMQTAKNSKMIAVGVKWGFRDEAELLENGADYIVSHPVEIFKLLNIEV